MANFKDDVSAAALLFLSFPILFLVLWAVAPPTPANLLASDPLIQLVAGHAGLWAIPVLSSLPALAWISLSPPSRSSVARAGCAALGGVGVAALGLLLLRLGAGPTLPDFVPPEESARAGITLGVGAGIVEEAVFRLGLLASAFLLARRVLPPPWAGVLAVVTTALAFAWSHEIGPGAGPFNAHFFATRFVVPGCLMSLLFFRPGPSFLVTLHCSAHVGIALLFRGAPPSA